MTQLSCRGSNARHARRALLGCLGSAIACLGALAVVAIDADAAGRTGRIVVSMIPPKGSSNTGFAVVCVVNGAGKQVGKCATPSKQNVAVLSRVPVGRWHIEGEGGVGGLTYPKAVRTYAGRTTRVTWHVPMWG